MNKADDGIKLCASRERRFPLSDLRFNPEMPQTVK
jgi:hypothetical protein